MSGVQHVCPRQSTSYYLPVCAPQTSDETAARGHRLNQYCHQAHHPDSASRLSHPGAPHPLHMAHRASQHRTACTPRAAVVGWGSYPPLRSEYHSGSCLLLIKSRSAMNECRVDVSSHLLHSSPLGASLWCRLLSSYFLSDLWVMVCGVMVSQCHIVTVSWRLVSWCLVS